MTNARRLILLTGAKGSGKSQFLSLLTECLQRTAPGLQMAGLLSPAVRQGGGKTAIEVVDLTSGDRRALARHRTSRTPGPSTPHWSFDRGAIQWANDRLQHAAGAELLVVDELGWLEFEQGEGFTRALQLLDRAQYQVALITVRPDLLAQARDRWRVDTIIKLDAKEDKKILAEQWCQRLQEAIQLEKGKKQ